MTLEECEDISCMTLTVLSLGANCGDREKSVKNALEWMRKILINPKASSIYATPDCHGSQREYLNAVVKGSTLLSLNDLKEKCKEYELQHGRTTESRRVGDVPIDIDIVIYDGKVIRPKDAERSFFTKGYNMV